MKAFLLAAGRGTRISKNIPEIPKCTLDVGGKPLILRTVDMLLKNNIEVTVIVGYKHAHIEQVLRDKQVHIVYNPFFDVTNSIGSLWLAKGYMLEDDTIIANADVFWSQELLDQLLAAAENTDVFMLADRRRAEDGDYFFDIEDGCIRKYGKELKREERNAEYVGIAYVNRQFLPDFVRRMDELVDGQNHNVWWENVLYSFIGEREIKALEVGESFWAEIDFIEDYHRINAYVSNTEEI
jgi:choline kinase